MAVDKGGLRYTIQVVDRFSKDLTKFRAEVAAAKKEVLGLNAARAQGAATQARAATAQRGFDREQIQRARRIQQGARQQAQNEQLRARVFRAQRSEASKAARQEIATFRQNAETQARIAKDQVANARKQTVEQTKANRAVRRGGRELSDMGRRAGRAGGAVNRISFSFRRLIGIMAVFQGARFLAGGVGSFVGSAIQFNRTIEDSRIGIASMLSVMGQLTDEQGRLLEGQEKFQGAVTVSEGIIEKLRLRSLATTATFEELLVAFRSGLGPGIEAGLDPDQIVDVAERVSQALAGLNLAQNQITEEIRSLLRGTATSRTSVVASVLFGGAENANKLIREAKKTGDVYKVITERLAPLRLAVQATQQTFTGLSARIRDASAVSGGAAAKGFFNELKTSLFEIAELFVVIERDSEGVIESILPRRETVAVLGAVFNAMARGVAIIREALSGINFGTIAAAFTGVAGIIEVVAAVLAGVIEGIILGFGLVSAAWEAFAGQLGDFDLKVLQDIIVIVVAIATALGTASLAVGILAGSFKLLKVSVNSTLTALKKFAVPLAAIAGGVFAALAGVTLFVNEVTGANLSLQQTGKIILQGIVRSFEAAIVAARQFFREIATDVEIDGLRRRLEFLDTLRDKTNRSVAAGATDAETAAPFLRTLEKEIDVITGKLTGQNKELDALQAKRVEILKTFDKFFDEDLNKILTNRDQGIDLSGITAEVKGLVSGLKAELAGSLDLDDEDKEKFILDFEATIQKAIERANAAFKGEGSGTEGALSPLEKFFQGIVTNFENGLAILRPIVQQFSAFVSDSIVSAFDPTDDTDLLERFARFLQQIAKLIIAQLVQIAIAKAVLGLTNPGDSGGAVAGSLKPSELPFGLAEGGDVPDRSAPKLLRPKGLDPRDTTQIWAQPGEFMVKKAVVDQPAVRDFLKALNSGLIAPSALRNLVGGRGSQRHISGIGSRGPRGYAEGGIIRQTADATASSLSSQSAGPPRAAIVANDQTMEKLLAGGSQAFRRHLEDNAQEFDGILRQGRSGG